MWIASNRNLNRPRFRLSRWRKGKFRWESLGSTSYPQDGRKHKECILLVHGYCNNLDDVHASYASIEDRMCQGAKQRAVDLRGFTWPSRGRVLGYWADLARAKKSRVALANVVAELNEIYDHVTIVAHSMGSLLTLHALHKNNLKAEMVRRIILHGADALWYRFRRGKKYGQVGWKIHELVSFHSKHDRVLAGVSKIGRPFPRMGNRYVPTNAPPNFRSIDANKLHKFAKVRHNTYKQSYDILKATHDIVTGGLTDDQKRVLGKR